MQENRLSKDELIHECGIRGHRVESAAAKVADLRVVYRGLLAKEADGEVLEDALIPVDVEGETLIIELKLADIEELLSAQPALLADQPDSATGPANRIRTLTSHCNKRLVRLLTHGPADQRNNVKALCRTLKERVETFRGLSNDKTVYNATSVPSVSSDRGEEREEREEQQQEEREENRRPPGPGKVLDLHKWGVKFSGKEEESVIGFLMDVEEKATWKGVKLNHLVAGAAELFDGRAKTWFRSMRTKLDSWNELKIAMRSEFLPLDYVDNLWDEIRGRKQGLNESMGAYVSNVMGMFERLELGDPVEEGIKLRYLVKNLAPVYAQHLALTDVLSVEQLKRLGRQIEVGKMRVESYDGKSKRKMEPDFALKTPQYRRPTVNAIVNQPDAGVPEVAAVSQSSTAGSDKPKLVCWKCREPGHVWSKCDSKKADVNRRFCYRCGDVAHIVRDCPKINKASAPGAKAPGEA